MKDLLLHEVNAQPNDFLKRSIMREFLQARILQSLQDHGAFTNWAFVGGTALRFLFRLPRYSEDLDFSLTSEKTDFSGLIQKVQKDLEAETYSVTLKSKKGRAIASVFFKFPGLLYEFGLSHRSTENISVKVEVDTNPPADAVITTTVLRRFVVLNLLHYDKASLFAGKIHAVLTRPYTKGRDLYDLVWYLADDQWPAPNLQLLNNALSQSGWAVKPLTKKTLGAVINKKLSSIDWQKVSLDVAPFLERQQDLKLLNLKTVQGLLYSRMDRK